MCRLYNYEWKCNTHQTIIKTLVMIMILMMIAPDLRRQNGWNVSSLIYLVFSVHLLEMSRQILVVCPQTSVQVLYLHHHCSVIADETNNNDERAIFSSMYVSSVLYFFFSVLCLLKMSIVRWVVVFQVSFIHYHSNNQHKKCHRHGQVLPCTRVSVYGHVALYVTLTPGTNRQLTRIRRQYCDTAYLLGLVTEITRPPTPPSAMLVMVPLRHGLKLYFIGQKTQVYGCWKNSDGSGIQTQKVWIGSLMA